jgi:hypothetical protein
MDFEGREEPPMKDLPDMPAGVKPFLKAMPAANDADLQVRHSDLIVKEKTDGWDPREVWRIFIKEARARRERGQS